MKAPSMVTVLAILVAAGSLCKSVIAQSASTDATLNSFIDSQTIAVMRINSNQLSSTVIANELAMLIPGMKIEIENVGRDWVAIEDSFRNSDVKEVFAVFSFADSYETMPFLVVRDGSRWNPQPLTNRFAFEKRNRYQNKMIGNQRLLASETTFHRLSARANRNDFDFAAALRSSGDADIAIVVRYTSDHLRALSEMQPNLPEAIGGGSTFDLLKDIESMRVSIEVPPEQRIEIVFQTSNRESAVQLDRRLNECKTALTLFEPLTKIVTNTPTLLEQFNTHTAGATVVLSVNGSSRETLNGLRLMLSLRSSPVGQLLVEQMKQSALTRLYKVWLGLVNCESAYKRFPMATEIEGDAKSQLSWRVQFLPFLGDPEAALWREFHLDEPWDSEHNKKLIPRMPEAFRIPLSRWSASDGRSTIVLPSSPTTMWPPGKISRLKDISDGLNQTIMAVEVDDENAQIWTKPEPFTIDALNPALGLGGHFENVIAILLGDGRQVFLPSNQSADWFNARFSRAGGETSPIP